MAAVSPKGERSKDVKRNPIWLGLAASAVLTILVVLGSRNLEHYDSALFGYTVASIVAFGAIVFRYALWLQRPATRVYWQRGWNLYFRRGNIIRNTGTAARTRDEPYRATIHFPRGFSRWAMPSSSCGRVLSR
jgi:hypothetical protein